MIEFFDRNGAAVAVSPDEQSLFLWNGEPAAFIENDKVFAYSGRFIGWSHNGWLTDDVGKFVLFESDAVGGPAKPVRLQKGGIPGPLQQKPMKRTPQFSAGRPQVVAEWSDKVFMNLV